MQHSYWRSKKQHEVDLVAETGSDIIPFEVKYRNRTPSRVDLTGLLQMAKQKKFERAYVVTKSATDLGEMVLEMEKVFQLIRKKQPIGINRHVTVAVGSGVLIPESYISMVSYMKKIWKQPLSISYNLVSSVSRNIANSHGPEFFSISDNPAIPDYGL